MNKQEEKLRALQMTLEELDNIKKETKYKEETKIKLENGLFLDIKKINDRRWIEEFNSKYLTGLAKFKALNPNKTTQEYINNEIEKINNIEAENKKIFNLSDDKFCDWLRNKYPVKFENSDIKNNNLKEHPFFIYQKKYFEPNEFEDYRITLYKQKLNELPKTEKLKEKRLGDKWYALLYWMELNSNGKRPPIDAEGSFNKDKLMIEGNKRTGKSGQVFYTSFKEIDINNSKAIERSFGKEWKEAIIKLSNNDNKIIDYLKEKYKS